MKNNKVTILIIVLLGSLWLSSVSLAHAKGLGAGCSKDEECDSGLICKDGSCESVFGPVRPPYPESYKGSSDGLGNLINNITQMVAVAAGILLFAYLLFGGFKYITAGGDEKAVDSAKRMLTNAVVGMIIIAFAYFIVGIIGKVLGIEIFKLEFPKP